MNRHRFLLSSGSAVGLAACSSGNAFSPKLAGPAPLSRTVAGAATVTRLEIAEFSQDAKLVAALRAGVKAMRADRMARHTGSWNYWHYSHWMPRSNPPPDMQPVWDQCKHAASYFQAWHRGFLFYFERVLREASGDPQLTLPYWDYYKSPAIPEIFAVPTLHDGSPNPLYWADRKGSVVEGLGFSAFVDSVTTFPWGPGETFEDLVERNPHNRVHNQIGGSMGEVPTAAADPIFYLHHCNIDRLWSAWVAAGGGRKMPPAQDLWWKQEFSYDLSRSWTLDAAQMNDTHDLGYTYSDLSLPVATGDAMLPSRPPVVATVRANGIGPVSLGLEPVTVAIALDEPLAHGAPFAVVLEEVVLSALGRSGGYGYSVYLNLPDTRTPLMHESAFEVGEFGSFSLSMPRMNGMAPEQSGRTLRFSTTPTIERRIRLGLELPKTILLSFVAYGKPAGVSRNAELARVSRIALVPG